MSASHSFALKRINDDEKFGFSVKSVALRENSQVKHLIVTAIVKNSPADRSGLKVGMVVVDINQVPLISGSTAEAGDAIKLTKPGQPLLMHAKIPVGSEEKVGSKAGNSLPTVPALPSKPTPKPKPRIHFSPATPPPTPTTPTASEPSTSRPSSTLLTPFTDTKNSIILDVGSWQCKVGNVGQVGPTVFPTVVGRHKLAVGPMAPPGGGKCFVGANAFAKKGILKLTYPYERGVVKDWNDMTSVWKYAFEDELRMEPKGSPLMLTEPIFTNKEQREKIVQIMFDTFEVSALQIVLAPLLGMFAANRVSDTLIVDVGESMTQVVPVGHDQNVVFMAAQKANFAGANVAERLAQLLTSETGHTFNTNDVSLRKILHECGKVAEDSSKVQEKAVEKQEFELPDGNKIEFGNEPMRAAEVLFDPSIAGLTSTKSIPEMIIEAAAKCEQEGKNLLENILLCGGTTMMPGFAERIQLETEKLAKQNLGQDVQVKVLPTMNGASAAWLGGIAAAKLPAFQHMWVTRKEFQELGTNVVHSKSSPLH